MYYVVDKDVAATLDGLAGIVRREMGTTHTRRVLDVVPYTEKGVPSKKYKPFRVQVFNYPEWEEIWVHGLDSCAYNCALAMREPFENNGILVVFKGDEPIYNY